MDVYDYIDYRKYLKDLVQLRRLRLPALTFSKLADAAGVQRSYLSQVLNGQGNFNTDQLYLISAQLQLDPETEEYLNLLLEIERCQVKARKERLISGREQLRTKAGQSDRHLNHEPVNSTNTNYSRYYCDPYCSLVHMFLMIPKYRADPELICSHLGIEAEKLDEVLVTLAKCSIVDLDKKRLKVLKPTIHLSHLDHLSRTNTTMLRLKSIERQQRKSSDQTDYFFTSTVCASREAKKTIKAKWLKLLEEVSDLVAKSEPEEVFQLNCDIFSWH